MAVLGIIWTYLYILYTLYNNYYRFNRRLYMYKHTCHFGIINRAHACAGQVIVLIVCVCVCVCVCL